MKISQTGSLTATPSHRVDKRKGTSSEKFGDHMSLEETAETQGVASVNGAAPVDSLLAVQEVDDPADRPAKARQRAEDILDRLDKVRPACWGFLLFNLSTSGGAFLEWLD
jgi:hypothetical protein